MNDAGGILEPAEFNNPLQQSESDFERIGGYGYAHWQVVQPLRLIGGVSYDRLTYPINFRYAPISDREDTIDCVSPKAGAILTPLKDTVLRAGYSRSLGGASIDQSFRLEPSQVAGFNQSWRSPSPAPMRRSALKTWESRSSANSRRGPTSPWRVNGCIQKSIGLSAPST